MGSETISYSDDSRDASMLNIPSSYSWTPSSELALFQAMISNKPAGINKHFAMAVVSEKLSVGFGSEVTSDVIWSKLRTMFDLTAVDDREEVIPFPLDQREFALPRKDFNSLIADKQKDINKDKSSGKSSKSVSRVSGDMGSESSRRDRERDKEAPVVKEAGTKVERAKADTKEDSGTSKAPAKRHVTRSTPNNTPNKKRK